MQFLSEIMAGKYNTIITRRMKSLSNATVREINENNSRKMVEKHVVRAANSCAEGAGDEGTQEGPFTLRQANQGTHAEIFLSVYFSCLLAIAFYQTL
jgi:hypothetical protein